MPQAFLTLTNIPANAVRDLMEDSDQGAQNLRFVRRPSRVTFAIDTNGAANGVEYEVFSGDRQIVERSAVPAGGTAGVMPKLNEVGTTFLAATDEIIKVRVRELDGVATSDINLPIAVDPIL